MEDLGGVYSRGYGRARRIDNREAQVASGNGLDEAHKVPTNWRKNALGRSIRVATELLYHLAGV